MTNYCMFADEHKKMLHLDKNGHQVDHQLRTLAGLMSGNCASLPSMAQLSCCASCHHPRWWLGDTHVLEFWGGYCKPIYNATSDGVWHGVNSTMKQQYSLLFWVYITNLQYEISHSSWSFHLWVVECPIICFFFSHTPGVVSMMPTA